MGDHTWSYLLNMEQVEVGDHIWPYLLNMEQVEVGDHTRSTVFKYQSRQGSSIKLVCLLCVPKHKEVSAFVLSPSNLRKHVEVDVSVCTFYNLTFALHLFALSV